jgi:hypothetical protein
VTSTVAVLKIQPPLPLPLNSCRICDPGRYKVLRFGPLEINAGETVYLRQIPDSKETPLLRTGGGIFEFFLPKMKMIAAAQMQKLVKENIKGPIVEQQIPIQRGAPLRQEPSFYIVKR